MKNREQRTFHDVEAERIQETAEEATALEQLAEDTGDESLQKEAAAAKAEAELSSEERYIKFADQRMANVQKALLEISDSQLKKELKEYLEKCKDDPRTALNGASTIMRPSWGKTQYADTPNEYYPSNDQEVIKKYSLNEAAPQDIVSAQIIAEQMKYEKKKPPTEAKMAA